MPISRLPGCDFPEHHGSGRFPIGALVVLAVIGAGVWWLVTATAFLAVTAAVLSVACVTGVVLAVRELRSAGPMWHPARQDAPAVPSITAAAVRPPAAIPGRPVRAIEAPRAVHLHQHLHLHQAQPVTIEENQQ